MVRWETLELVRAYDKVADAGVRKGLFNFTKVLGAAEA